MCGGEASARLDVDCSELPCIVYVEEPTLYAAAQNLAECPDWQALIAASPVFYSEMSLCGIVTAYVPSTEGFDPTKPQEAYERIDRRLHEKVLEVNETRCAPAAPMQGQ